MQPIPDQIDEATNYIKQLQENVENLRQRRDSLLLGVVEGSQDDNSSSTRASYPSNSPVRIEVTENGRAMEVTLITRLESQSKFTDVMHIFHEENVEVVKASYSVHENTVFHTIHAKVTIFKPCCFALIIQFSSISLTQFSLIKFSLKE